MINMLKDLEEKMSILKNLNSMYKTDREFQQRYGNYNIKKRQMAVIKF